MNPTWSLQLTTQFYVLYARQTNLLDLPGWKRFRALAKRKKNMMREVNFAKLCRHRSRVKFKYDYEVPKDFNHAVDTDQLNGNTLW